MRYSVSEKEVMSMRARHSGNPVAIRFSLPAFALSLLLIFSTANLSGCTRKSPRSHSFFGTFDTVATLYDYSRGTESEFREYSELFESELSRYHRLYDIYHEYEGVNNLATLNANAGKGPVTLPEEVLSLLAYGIDCYEKTSGCVNIVMGALTRIWHDAREAETPVLPEENLLTEASEHCDISGLVLDLTANTAELTDTAMRVDAGAIAKGYAIECTAKALEHAGATGYVLDVGGNLRAIGTKPDGSGWSCGVKNPFGDEKTVFSRNFSNAAAATSGSYERKMTVNGIEYGHIIDPKTCMPANNYAGVTVWAPDTALADALSTALFILDYEAGCALAQNYENIFVVWVMHDGEVRTFGENSE